MRCIIVSTCSFSTVHFNVTFALFTRGDFYGVTVWRAERGHFQHSLFRRQSRVKNTTGVDPPFRNTRNEWKRDRSHDARSEWKRVKRRWKGTGWEWREEGPRRPRQHSIDKPGTPERGSGAALSSPIAITSSGVRTNCICGSRLPADVLSRRWKCKHCFKRNVRPLVQCFDANGRLLNAILQTVGGNDSSSSREKKSSNPQTTYNEISGTVRQHRTTSSSTARPRKIKTERGFRHVVSKRSLSVTDNSYLSEEFDEMTRQLHIRKLDN